MKILYITTVFPESESNSTIYTDLAEELAKQYKVTVVTNIERKKKKNTYISEERGCTVLRIKTGNQYNVGFIEKGITLMTMSFLFKKGIKKYLSDEKFDLILYESPPVTVSNIIKFAKKKYNTKTFLMLKDIFPQNAVDIGIIKSNGLIFKYYKHKENSLYSVSDKIGCMSQLNLEYIKKRYQKYENKLTIFENTKKFIPNRDYYKNNNVLDKYGIPKDKILFIFGGNMGKPQGMDFLVRCIKECSCIKEAFFILVGRGSEKNKVKTMLAKATNALVFDEMSRDDYEQLLSFCDIGIISLDYNFTIPNYPSKVLSYMNLKKPILAITDEKTDFKNLILDNHCGYWIASNSVNKFKRIIKTIINDDERETKGINGYNYFKNNLTVDKSVKKIKEFMEESK